MTPSIERGYLLAVQWPRWYSGWAVAVFSSFEDRHRFISQTKAVTRDVSPHTLADYVPLPPGEAWAVQRARFPFYWIPDDTTAKAIRYSVTTTTTAEQ